MNKYMYCKINNSNKIYMVENIEDNVVKARHDNLVVLVHIDKVTFIDKPQNIRTNNKCNIQVSEKAVPNEIMLRHLTKDISIDMLDKYVDQAIVAKLSLIKIIHGKHGGVLKSAVHDYLSKSPFVESYRLGYLHEGGVGVTVVKLKLVIE